MKLVQSIIVFNLLFLTSFASGDWSAVFTLDEVRKELDVTEEELELVRSLNLRSLAERRAIATRVGSSPIENARLRKRIVPTDLILLETLSPTRRQRLTQLVFQFRLCMNQPRKAFEALEKDIPPQINQKVDETQTSLTELQIEIEFQLQKEQLSHLFSESRIQELVGSRYKGVLPEFRDPPLDDLGYPEFSRFPSVEPLRFLLSRRSKQISSSPSGRFRQ